MESFSSLAEDYPSPLPSAEDPSDLLNVTNMTLMLGPVRDPLYIVIPITILYALIFLTGVVGNVVTCIVIARNKHMHTATNYYLFSLAVSDLLLLVSGLPQEMYIVWSRYPYIFGEVFCVLRGLAAETSANATVLTITAFTVERYVAICHPFLSHTMSKLSRAIKLIVVIWLVALGFAIPQAIQFGVIYGRSPEDVQCLMKKIVFSHSFELSTFLFFVTPMTLITVLYALIGMRLRRSSMVKQEAGSFSCKHATAGNATCCRQHQQSQGGRFEVESVGGMKFGKREDLEKNPKNSGVAHNQYPSGVVRIPT
ncbi:Pyrokinin-1 receptor [Blattella germanica]|nr:Pyrokinin-1 receptor [Blattella germanica]